VLRNAAGRACTIGQHRGGASNGHFGGNAETYMNVGEAMVNAMIELRATNEETTRK